MDYYNESGCFSIQMNDESVKHIYFEPKLIISSSPLVMQQNNRIMKSHSIKQSNGLSLKAKLKSKIFSRRVTVTNKTTQQTLSSFSLYEKISYPTQHQANLVSQFYKIMDKSLGWFKQKKFKSKQSKKSQQKSNTPQSENKNELIYENATLPEFNQTSSSFQFISTPIKQNHSFKIPKPVSSPIDITFNDQVVHSTPYSIYSRNYNHQCCATFNSTNTSSCYSSRSGFSSNTRSRVVFGMTSSPNTSITDFDDQELNESSIQANNGLIETNLTSDNKNEFSRLDSKEKLLVEHLNLIKENVRMGYELRNLKTNQNSMSVKRSFNQMNEQLQQQQQINSTKQDNLTSKKRKLQSMFQTKLQQQLKEVKKWQFNFKKTNILKSANLSTSTKISKCIYINNQNNLEQVSKHACQCCNCQNNYYF